MQPSRLGLPLTSNTFIFVRFNSRAGPRRIPHRTAGPFAVHFQRYVNAAACASSENFQCSFPGNRAGTPRPGPACAKQMKALSHTVEAQHTPEWVSLQHNTNNQLNHQISIMTQSVTMNKFLSIFNCSRNNIQLITLIVFHNSNPFFTQFPSSSYSYSISAV